MKCDHCKKPLTRKPKVTEVIGIVHERKGGGTHQLRQQKPTGRVWCDSCGETLWHTGRLPSLVPEGQTSLI